MKKSNQSKPANTESFLNFQNCIITPVQQTAIKGGGDGDGDGEIIVQDVVEG